MHLSNKGFIKSNQNPFFNSSQDNYWNLSHAMLPVIGPQLNENCFSMFYSSRNKKNQSFIGRFDLEITDELFLKVNNIAKDPILSPGKLGCFDDNGVSPSCYILAKNNVHHLYYVGWKPRSTTRFSLVAGLATSYDGENFKRYSSAPLLYQNNLEPLNILTAPWVIVDNDIYRMWYVSGVEWIHEDLPKYNIKYAESNDGLKWNQTGIVALDNHNEFTAIARPSIIKNEDKYCMWYSAKKANTEYEIYYAESKDGINWDYSIDAKEKNCLKINKEKNAWDSKMVEYSYVSKFKNNLLMFYNGNQYGETGIGLAYKKYSRNEE